MIRDRIPLALLILAALALAAPLWGPGMVNTRGGGDSPFLLQRLQQMVVNLRAGVFPVRWMPDGAYGLGFPFFNYYSALPYYLAAGLAVAGFDLLTALKLVQTVGFVAAALTMYGWMRRLTGARWMAWLAALGYTAAPFHLVNVYVRGDSLSEFYAFIFYPLVLWGLDRVAGRVAGRAASGDAGAHIGAQWLVPAGAYAALVCSHNISALIFSPFALLYPLVLLVGNGPGAARRPKGARLRMLATCYLALGCGLLLSAWVWGPALAETGFAQTATLTGDYFHYSRHFRTANLVQGGLFFDYSVTPGSESPFAMGLVQAVLALCGVIALWVRRLRLSSQRQTWGREGFLLLGLLVSTVMITPLSKPLWDRLPLLAMIQFPWRFLSVQALFAAAVLAALVPRERWRRRVSLPLGLLLVLAMLLPLHPDRLAIAPADVTNERLQLFELFTQNIGTTIRAEWLPRAVVPRPFTSDGLVEPDVPLSAVPLEAADLQATLLERRPTRQTWRVQGAGGNLALPLLYWPGWTAYVDGVRVAAEPLEGAGYVTLAVPAGEHDVSLRLRRTPVRAAAEAVSLCALVVALAFCWLARWRIRWTSALGHFALTIFPAFAFLLVPQGAPVVSSSLTMDFDQIPYLHASADSGGGPGGIRFEGAVRLASYELSAQELVPGDTLTVAMDWYGVDEDYTVAVQLVSPAALRYEVQPLAEVEAPAPASATGLDLHLPADTPRGVYLVQVRLYAPSGELHALTSGGQPRGILYLQPVRVPQGPPLSPDLAVLAPFGPAVRLHAAAIEQPAPDRLRVRLDWSVAYRLASNYGISLRLLDAQDGTVNTLDTQPGYGYLPTGMWRPGELVTDQYELLLPEDVPPADGYRLLVILYQVQSGKPVGQARLGDFPLPLDGLFEMQQQARRFELPEFAAEGGSYPRQLGVTFGGQVRLAGYELAQSADELCLTPWWQALQTPAGDYTVFVHLFDPQTEAVAVQSDAMPRQGTYPTSWWSTGEVVSETICLAPAGAPRGTYRVAIGLYDRTMTRLPALDAAGQPIPAGRVILPASVDLAP